MIALAQSVESAAHIPETVIHSTMVRVPDVDRHYQHVQSSGVQVLKSPETHLFGERQYTVVDPGYHVWTFTQSVADMDPAEWGGTLVAAE